jgi:superfamily II DNA or RNA helicase
MSMYEEKRKRELQVRAEIIKSAENKFAAFREIIKRISINEKTIVFCTDTVQLKGCSQILDEFSKSYRIYHSGSELSDNQLKEHIKEFEQGDSDILVGIGCLDEGVDIAGCTTCVLVSSSGTEREYIQRRGRVLRLGDIGKIAHIYDLITYPPSLTDEEMNEQESTVNSILKREMTRTDILIEAADRKYITRKI